MSKLELMIESKRKSAQNHFMKNRKRNEDLNSKDAYLNENESQATLVRYRDDDSQGAGSPASPGRKPQLKKSPSPPNSP